jgi:hypothetical protein
MRPIDLDTSSCFQEKTPSIDKPAEESSVPVPVHVVVDLEHADDSEYSGGKDISESQHLFIRTANLDDCSKRKVVKHVGTTHLGDDSTHQCSLLKVLYLHWPMMLSVSLVLSFWGCTYYSTLVWMSYYMSDPQLIGAGSSNSAEPATVKGAWFIGFGMNCCLVVLFPFAGMFGDYLQCLHKSSGRATGNNNNGDREGLLVAAKAEESTQRDNNNSILDGLEQVSCVGYERALRLAVSLCIIISVPAFLLITTCNPYLAAIGQFSFVGCLALFGANVPAFLVSKFPCESRFLGVGIGKLSVFGWSFRLRVIMFQLTTPLMRCLLAPLLLFKPC